MGHLNKSSRNPLNRRHLEHFTGDSLFDRVARAVCEADCLPRKELYEAWETAKRVRRKMRGGPVVELAAGHGLLGALLLIMDDRSPAATCVDIQQPPSFAAVLQSLEKQWPRIKGRVAFREEPMEAVAISPDSLVVSVHACGALTDQVLELAVQARSRVAVLPCCHDLKTCDTGDLAGWMDGPLAVDAARVARLRQEGYRVQTALIPEEITPKNRLMLGWPDHKRT